MRRRRPPTRTGKSAAMSSTEMPYSWNRARAIRCRTSSLGVSLTSLVPEMKSRVKPSRTTSVLPAVAFMAPSKVVVSAAAAFPEPTFRRRTEFADGRSLWRLSSHARPAPGSIRQSMSGRRIARPDADFSCRRSAVPVGGKADLLGQLDGANRLRDVIAPWRDSTWPEAVKFRVQSAVLAQVELDLRRKDALLVAQR